jgi:hypothetical protein
VTPDPGATFDTAFNVGDLNGAVTLNDTVTVPDATDVYKFTMARPGQFFGRLRVQSGEADISVFGEERDAQGNLVRPRLIALTATHSGPDNGFASGDLPGLSLGAGTFYVVVTRRTGEGSYLVRMTADFAGNSLGTARNIGSATDETFRDFVGLPDSPSLTDAGDIYKVKMDARGRLTATLKTDLLSDTFQGHVDLIRDVNGNGLIDAGDLILHAGPGTTAGTSRMLDAGTYFVRVGSDINFFNYHLRITADYAGNTPALQRDMGSLDAGRSFQDFISASTDKVDQYRFSVGSARELNVVFVESGGGKSQLILVNDRNNNGVADPGEGVLLAEDHSFSNTVRTVQPGNYLLQVVADSGEGTYQLFAEARPDRAGNTLGTARELGTVNGLKHEDDFVSSVDLVDFYKFTASAGGKVSARLDPALGANADLALIRDANNNGKVDAGEVLAASPLPGNKPEELSATIAAGNYFLRVTFNDIEGTASKYFLSFHTDYAGRTPVTARNVGTLVGPRAFDDWASGPFSGVISDTGDVYKFNLTSTRTLTAKLTGTQGGQDLDLEVYRDKNNDGVLTADELVASSRTLNSANEQVVKSLGAGTYFVRVAGVNGETNYHLALNA